MKRRRPWDSIPGLIARNNNGGPRETRTRDPLIKNQLRGFAKGKRGKDLGKHEKRLGVLLGVLAGEIAPLDADLADVVRSWESLPLAMKGAVLAVVKAARGIV